jgi:hypothetical protein
MAIDFPASPTTGDQVTSGSIVWEYDGEKWVTLKSLFNRGILTDGTEAAPGTVFNGDTDTGIYSPGANTFAISTGGVQRVELDANEVVFNEGGHNYDFRVEGDTEPNLIFADASADTITFRDDVTIDSNGNVGIGTASPSTALELSGATDPVIRVNRTVSGHYGEFSGISGSANINGVNGAGGAVIFRGDGNERARIDTSGRLLVGTSSVSGDITIAAQGNSSTSTGPAYLQLRRGALPSDTQSLGWIEFADNSGNVGAQIYGEADQNWTSGSAHGSGLVFSTTANGASSPTERMRIDNNGKWYLDNVDLFNSTYVGQIRVVDTGGLLFRNGGSAARYPLGFQNSAGTFVGSVSAGNSSTQYNTSSDYRLKENVVQLTDAINRITQLQVHRFNFIQEPDRTVDGFIAHEVQAVVPECVTGTKDEVDDEGNPVYQGIDQSKLVPLLTAALQEAIAKIETLETRLTALEGGAS